ncbi:hypothetical protein N0V93_009501 [Gnomoniopsis smithogilvyi]|uniref:5-oxoprolinase n=1 Tax=Gnomoniopsis smithogilvyi TaxID=1191159 RepID=A0A9W8YKZ3_9PEZI|nr:hypothetical protein N0V93_009501 [Gnomoniopsis smithogilvyi]
MTAIRVAIDRGGTFCDVIAHIPGKEPVIFKLLSEDPANYRDAPTEAIRRVLEVAEGRKIPPGQQLNASNIQSCRIGTTIATNALLEHKGEKFALLTTKGHRDVCIIGDQSRPKLFDLKVRKAQVLHDKVLEVDERVTIEDYDLNPHPLDKHRDLTDPALVRTASGEIIRILQAPDAELVRKQLEDLQREGYSSVAISFMHAYVYPEHEDMVARIAKDVGFKYVTTSSSTSPNIKFLIRSNSTCSEAYLYPVIRRYVESFESGFEVLPQRFEFMCSDGGLKQAHKFKGNEALLSGPAGGVVGIAKSCYGSEDGTAIIGFDMGGTSTDVARYDGKYDYISESTIAGRTINVPMLNIATVAAGGGSILFARNGLLVVGPDSAGAHPGPACYRKGGPLTVTDANLFLGRLVLSSFPSIFGPNADQALDKEVIVEKFRDITIDFNIQTGQNLSPEDVALGFLNVANEAMSRPIRNATEARGFAPENHNLVCFGGAGGQHSCSIAEKLGIRRILIHRWSSLLSAHGISLADLQYEAFEPYANKLDADALVHVEARFAELKKRVQAELQGQGADELSLSYEWSLVLRYFGTDSNITISKPADGDYAKSFEQTHLREFAFSMNRDIIIESIRVRGTGSTAGAQGEEQPDWKKLNALLQNWNAPSVEYQAKQQVYMDGSWKDTRIFELGLLPQNSVITGPALIIDKTQTIFVEQSFKAILLESHVVLEKITNNEEASLDAAKAFLDAEAENPIQLSVFAHRFMAIAEQMGNTLQRTSISTSIKERLDFSCAIFSPTGKLVANAPHIPIHLGSMQFAIQAQHRHWLGKLKDGDVLVTNHPQWGGTHLPDLTVVTPVFLGGEIAFYVASRGHHTDIGGKGITSMMPESKELWEEGINIETMKIVSGGTFLEKEVREAFEKAGEFPGCSVTRRMGDNISDLKAQVSANQRGIVLLRKLCEEYSLAVVHKYMNGIQKNAELAVREWFKKFAKEHPEPLTATDYLDDGTPMTVTITIDGETGGAIYDFTGSGPQTWGNYNCPISICHSSIIYTIRCLVDSDIPLNEGCLAPVELRVPPGSILNPSPAVAICGSTLASQRVIDTILRAFGRHAASSGCANSFGWGMGGKDPQTGKVVPGWNYGETVGGGVGACDGYDGEHGTHVHSTNTKATDPEVIEKRTAVLIRKNEIREGSGGKGKWTGGCGIIREVEARIPLKFSILSDRRVFRPYGMAGGMPGEVGTNFAFKRTGKDGGFERINLGGKAVLDLQAGEWMQINSSGGGGYGI